LTSPARSRFSTILRPLVFGPRRSHRPKRVPGGLLKPPTDVEFGVIVDRETAGIIWGKGIQDQGIGKGDTGWEKYNASQNPNAKLLRSNATAFDLFEEATGEAISAKTLNTQSMGYIKNPQKIFDKLRTYIDAAVNYQPRRMSDINPAKIETKTIQLAIPEYTSPEQWRYLLRAIIYGKENGVTVVITRIRQ
jgi:filamentous hemagglutinin